MLADFYIPRLSNDMKIGIQTKSYFWVEFSKKSLVPVKQRRL